MAWRRGKITDWIDDSADSWLGNVFGHSWSDSVASRSTFGQLLSQLNSTQPQVQPRWIDWHQHWQPNSKPDQQGTLTVTSDSSEGFVTDATVTAHVTDPDGVRWRTIKYQWSVEDGDGNWTPIDGATSASLKLTSEFLGKQIDVTATYVDRKGHFSTVADPFPVTSPDTKPEPAPPIPDQPGHIELTPSTGIAENDVVTATVVDADGVQTVSYQWQVHGANGQWQDITGANSETLTITPALAGKEVEVVATYTDGAQHSTTLTQAFTVAPPPQPPAPEPDQLGQLALSPNNGYASGVTVQATVSDADGVDATSEKFQWRVLQNGVWQDIANATTDSLNLTNALAGKNVELVVAYNDQAGHSATLTRAFAVAALLPPPPPPNLPGSVAIAAPGGLKEGSTLTANVSDSDGYVASSVSYTWQENVGGAWQNIGTGKSHTIGFAEGGHDIRVLASYTDNAGHVESLQSPAVAAVDVDRPGTLTVSSSGGFVEGATITTSLTDLDGVTSGSVHYQWSSMGSDGLWHPIGGATSASYTLTAADAGKQIDVVANYVDRQGHQDSAADPFTVAAPPPTPSPPGGGSGATLLWSQEFDTPLDMKSSLNPDGLWAPLDFWQNINSGGYKDFAGANWNINPNNPTFAPYSPFSVENGYLQIESFRTPTELVGPIQQEMNKQGTPGAVPEWSGGVLITNKDAIEFTYGYFEFRASFPEQGKGMFPAMWFYGSRGSATPNGKGSAEIDLFEMFGVQDHWATALHGGPASPGVGSQSEDTHDWHTYGMLWEPDLLQFYRDQELLYTVTGPGASYYNDVPMAIRVNFAMDAPWFDASRHSDSGTPSMQMQIDYIRQYAELPFLTGTG